MSESDIPQLKAFEVAIADGVLTAIIRKEFDFGSLHQDWAHTIITLHPGPYRLVRVDMTHCGLVSSTFFAGLMQLHFHYTPLGSQPLHLLKPDPRVVRNLTVMKMLPIFIIESR